MEHDREQATAIIADFGARPELLVQILHRFMDTFGTISDEAQRQLADELNLSRAEVHGVVSYYHDFRTDAPSRNVIRICAAESCQAMGSRELARHAAAALGQPMGSSNGELRLEPVYCLGNCACSPAVMVNGKTYGRVSPDRFDEIVAAALEQAS